MFASSVGCAAALASRIGPALAGSAAAARVWRESRDGAGFRGRLFRGAAINMTSAGWMHQSSGLVGKADMHRFVRECMLKAGASDDNSEAMADLLVAADYRGHFSHGLNRLEMYVRDLETKSADGQVTPTVLTDCPGTAWVDGNNGLGPLVGNFCMKLAMKKAKDVGIAMVVAKRSNHYGIAGWYSMLAAEQKMIGFSCTNTSPFGVPTRAKTAALGTNPISLAAPGKDGDMFVLDMATTAVAVGKIEVKRRKGEELPKGWAIDAAGQATTSPDALEVGGHLMPLGGPEETSGYKGYGLAVMVEVLCGILSGSLYGPSIRLWGSNDEEANLGQCFMAIDPASFAPGFEGRMQDLMNSLRSMEPYDPQKKVLVAGDPERAHMRMVDEAGGIPYSASLLKAMVALSEKLGVTPCDIR